MSDDLIVSIKVAPDEASAVRAAKVIGATFDRELGATVKSLGGIAANSKSLKGFTDDFGNFIGTTKQYKKSADEAKSSSDKLNASFEHQIKANRAVVGVMHENTEILKSSSAQSRLLNSALHSTSGTIDKLKVSLVQELEALNAKRKAMTSLAVANTGLTDTDKKVIEATRAKAKAIKEYKAELDAAEGIQNKVYRQVSVGRNTDITSMSKGIMDAERARDKQANIDRMFESAQNSYKPVRLVGDKTLMQRVLADDEDAVRKMAKLYDQAVLMQKNAQAKLLPRQVTVARTAETLTQRASLGDSGAVRQLAKLQDQAKKMDEIMNKGFFAAAHNRMREIALVTTEATRAFFGLSLALGAVTMPAMFGVKYIKDIEDAKMGMAGALVTMGKFTEGADKFKVTMSVADGVIKSLEESSIKFGVPLTDIVGTFRAVVSSGLQAGMTLAEVGKAATVGAVAVKSLGLNSTQVTQELRDVFMGGIMPSSSTLATSLGLRDSDIKKAKANAEAGIKSFYDFLMEKLEGYELVAANRAQTLSGAFDVLMIKAQRLFSSDSTFAGIKDIVNEVSDSIGKLDQTTGKLTFNPSIVKAVEAYNWAIQDIIGSIKFLIGITKDYGGTVAALAVSVGAVALVSASFTALGNIKLRLIALTNKMKLSYAEAAMVAQVSAAVQGKALTSIETKAIGARAAVATAVGTTGLIGLALFGLYEVADMMGWIDKIMDTAERRTKKFADSIKGSSAGVLEGQMRDLLQEKSSIERMIAENNQKSSKPVTVMVNGKSVTTKVNVSGNVDLLDQTKRLGEIDRQMQAIKDQQKKNADAESVTFDQSAQGLAKRIDKIREGRKSELLIEQYYTKELKANQRDIELVQKRKFEPLVNKTAQENESDRLADLARKEEELSILKSNTQQLQLAKKQELESLKTSTTQAIAIEKQRLKGIEESFQREAALQKRQYDLKTKQIDQAVQFGLSEEAANSIRQSIVSQQLADGTKLAEQERIALQAKTDLSAAEKLARDNKLASLQATIENNSALAQENLLLKQQHEELNKIKAARELRKDIRDVGQSAEKARLELTTEQQKRYRTVDPITMAGEEAASKYIQSEQGRLNKYTDKIESAKDQMDVLRDMLSSGKIDTPEFIRSMGEQHDNIKSATQAYDDLKSKVIGAADGIRNLTEGNEKVNQSFGGGWDKAFTDYKNNAESAASSGAKAFQLASKTMEDAITQFAMTGKIQFGSLVKSILQGLVEIAAKKATTAAFDAVTSSGGMSGMFSAAKSFFGFSQGGAFDGVKKFAKGAAFGTMMATAPMAFANGGAFTNGIYNTPQLFKFADGGQFKQGVLGEAGPEAVMPLKRGANGSLGVVATGSSSSNTIVNVVVNVDANGNASTNVDAVGMGKGLGDVIGDKVRQVIIEESRPNGLLNKGR